MKGTADFDVTRWNPLASDSPSEGPSISRIEISKSFQSPDMTGESEGEGLFCGMNDPAKGAGYLVSERFTGKLGDRKGSFVVNHGGLMGEQIKPSTFGDIVPGSGTGQLTGISGTVEIGSTEEGKHQMILEYSFSD